MHVYYVHLWQTGEVEMFSPKAQLRFLFGRRPREQRLVQAQLAEVPAGQNGVRFGGVL